MGDHRGSPGAVYFLHFYAHSTLSNSPTTTFMTTHSLYTYSSRFQARIPILSAPISRLDSRILAKTRPNFQKNFSHSFQLLHHQPHMQSTSKNTSLPSMCSDGVWDTYISRYKRPKLGLNCGNLLDNFQLTFHHSHSL